MAKNIRPGIGVFTLLELVARAREKFGGRVFAQRRLGSGEFARVTYERLYDDVVRLGAALGKRGVAHGTRVGVIGENRYEWAVAYLAVTGGGAVCVPLDPQLKAKEIGRILETAEAEVVISSPASLAVFKGLRNRLPKLRDIISMGEAEDGARGWADALAEGDDESAREEYLGRGVALDDLAVLLFTSGTTGTSKAVMLTHRNLGANVDQVYGALVFDERDVFLSLLPLHHTFEATAGMLIPIAAGCAVTYARSFKSREIVEDIRDAGVTMMCGVPLLYEKMLAGLRRAVNDSAPGKRALFTIFMAVTRAGHVVAGVNLGRFLFSSLRKKAGLDTIRMFISGAAPLKAEVTSTFYYLGLNLLQGYGLTETSPVVSVNVPERIKFASSGPPIPGVRVRIHEPNAEGVGEVAVAGDNIMVGYYGDPAMTSGVLRDGWFYTGDAGWLDRDGYVYITGRIKNVIVTAAGKNVYPEEIEAELGASAVIAEAAVMPMRDPSSGREAVGAVIFPDYEYLEGEASRAGEKLDDAFTESRIRDAVADCCRTVADYKRVKIIKIRKEEFPKTTTRKIKKYLFRDGEQVREA
ncbi:MAG TPA: AMP-binding protein [bacterium]|nr:AMP-binding protein [bacterium]